MTEWTINTIGMPARKFLWVGVLSLGILAVMPGARSGEVAGQSGAGAAVVHRHMRKHALSLVGKPKFGPHFKHFDWVNPNAPKGG